MANNNGYVDVSLIGPEVEEIFAILMHNGIPPAVKHDLHCTMMYDKRDLEAPLVEVDPTKEFKANVTKLEVLGDGLVFHLTSTDLADEHRRLKEGGYEHSFPDFLPHMSLTYDFNNYDRLRLEHAFQGWEGRELTFGKEGYGVKLK